MLPARRLTFRINPGKYFCNSHPDYVRRAPVQNKEACQSGTIANSCYVAQSLAIKSPFFRGIVSLNHGSSILKISNTSYQKVKCAKYGIEVAGKFTSFLKYQCDNSSFPPFGLDRQLSLHLHCPLLHICQAVTTSIQIVVKSLAIVPDNHVNFTH